jgi:hypothetical protein
LHLSGWIFQHPAGAPWRIAVAQPVDATMPALAENPLHLDPKTVAANATLFV